MQRFTFLVFSIRDTFRRHPKRFCWTTMAAIISICPLSVAKPATMPFTFQISGEASAFGTPSSGTPNLPTTVTGSGLFVPFGSAVYTEAGTVTFAMLPTGGFAPASTSNTFTMSFDEGADTFSGTNRTVFGAPNAAGFPTFTSTYTILSGTGIFEGANGSASANGISNRDSGAIAPSPVTPVSSSGSGQINAVGLTAAPEPGNTALIGLAIISAAHFWKKRWSR